MSTHPFLLFDLGLQPTPLAKRNQNRDGDRTNRSIVHCFLLLQLFHELYCNGSAWTKVKMACLSWTRVFLHRVTRLLSRRKHHVFNDTCRANLCLEKPGCHPASPFSSSPNPTCFRSAVNCSVRPVEHAQNFKHEKTRCSTLNK